MAYIGNEDGVRDRYSYHKRTRKACPLTLSVLTHACFLHD